MDNNIHRTRARVTVALLMTLLLVAICAGCGGAPAPSGGGQSGTATLAPTGATATEAPPTATLVPATAAQPATATHTPTPTTVAAGIGRTPEAASACAGLAGELEVHVLVGPAAAVGMEPLAVGSVPFVVDADGPPYAVEGGAPIEYEASEGHDWGSYSVTLAMDLAVSGLCSGTAGGEQLDLELAMTGEQHTTVVVEGMTWEYPWVGSHTLELSYPLHDGASAEGEGWVVVLHLAGP